MLLDGKAYIGGSVEDSNAWQRIQIALLNALKMPMQVQEYSVFEGLQQGSNGPQPPERADMGEGQQQKQQRLRDDGDGQQQRLGKRVRTDTKSPDAGLGTQDHATVVAAAVVAQPDPVSNKPMSCVVM